MMDSDYEFVEGDEFRADGGIYREKYWRGGTLEVFPKQVGRTCTHHTMTKVVEFMHLYPHQKEKKLPPFNENPPFTQLSVQFLVDCTSSKAYEKTKSSEENNKPSENSEENNKPSEKMGSRERSSAAVVNDGILAFQDYAISGLRGEKEWIRNRHIFGRPRYGVSRFKLIKDVGSSKENYRNVRKAVKRGPVYIDFSVDAKYHKHNQELPHGKGTCGSHAVCCVGYGYFLKNCDVTYYLIYVNSYGPDWGHRGRGRIKWNAVKNALIPKEPRVLQYSLRHPPTEDTTSSSSSDVSIGDAIYCAAPTSRARSEKRKREN